MKIKRKSKAISCFEGVFVSESVSTIYNNAIAFKSLHVGFNKYFDVEVGYCNGSFHCRNLYVCNEEHRFFSDTALLSDAKPHLLFQTDKTSSINDIKIQCFLF